MDWENSQDHHHDDGNTSSSINNASATAEDQLPTGLLPYYRARLYPWLKHAGIDLLSESAPSTSMNNNNNNSSRNHSSTRYETGTTSRTPPPRTETAAATTTEKKRDSSSSYLGNGPCSTVDVRVYGFELTVPYDREPGPTQRYAEMYFKALKTTFSNSGRVLKTIFHKPSATATVTAKQKLKGARRSLFPMQFNLRVDGLVVRFEHHPMEKWFALHGPLLKKAAIQAHLWGEAVATVQHADSTISPLHAGMVESSIAPSSTIAESNSLKHGEKTAAAAAAAAAAATAAAAAGKGETSSNNNNSATSDAAAKEQAWEGLMRDLAAQYRSEVTKAVEEAAALEEARATGAQRPSPSTSRLPCDDLFIVSAESIQILAVVGGGGSNGHESSSSSSSSSSATTTTTTTSAAEDAALKFICSMDTASRAVELTGAKKLRIDLVLFSPCVKLGSSPQPFISSERIVISGPVAVAKQRTAPPTTASRTIAVGAHRRVSLQTNVRGCKAPWKLYTDVVIDTQRFSVVHGPGYEPTMALVGMAGKRLAPSDPDRSAPRPPPVPWWDDLRYLWRGKALFRATPLRVILAAHQLPVVDETSERMAIRASSAEVHFGAAGHHSFDFQGFSCNLYQSTGVESPGGSLLALPFIHAPVAKINVQFGWKLPGGRLPGNHHLFPPVAPEEGLQVPIVLAHEFKAEGLDVALDVFFGEGATAVGDPLSAATTTATGATAMLLSGDGGSRAVAQGTSIGFLGDHQMVFLRDFSRNMRSTPAHIKACAKRGTFFVRKPRGGPPKKGIPRLLQLFRLSISAEPLEIVHFTVDADDPSAGLHLSASSASFGAAWLLNQPLPSFLQLPPHARGLKTRPSSSSSSSSQLPPPTRTITQDFSLNLGDITMHRDDPNDDFGDFLPDSPDGSKLMAAALGTTTSTTSNVASGSYQPPPLDPMTKLQAAANASANNTTPAACEVEDEEGARHAAALLQSLVDRRRTAAESTSSVLSAATLSVSRRPKSGDDDDGGGGGGGGGDDDPSFDPLSAAFGQRQSRPLRVVVSNCRFLMDLGTRDAVWGAVSHYVAAFGSRQSSTTTTNTAGAAAGNSSGASRFSTSREALLTPSSSRLLSPLGSLLSPSSAAATSMQRRREGDMQRRNSSHDSASLRSPSSTSELAPSESNELLSLLLQQREAAGGDLGSSLNTPQTSNGEELPFGDSDYAADEGDGGDGDAPMTTPLDDVHSLLRYEVEVSDFQVMMLTATEAGPGSGRLLLAAKSGRLRGLTLADGPAPLQITTLGLEAVQAYVSVTDIDPHVSLTWLQVDENGFSAPLDGGPAALRRVFNPICIDLRHSKASSSAMSVRRGPSTNRAMSLRSPLTTRGGGGAGGASLIKSDELVLKVRINYFMF